MTTYATLCFPVRDGQVLLLRKAEGLWGGGKWNGPGGKLLAGEDPEQGAAREVREETGLQVRRLRFSGVLRFRFGTDGPPAWVVYVFTAEEFSGSVTASREGLLRWHPVQDLPLDRMWEDDRYWLPQVLAGRRVWGDFHFDAQAEHLEEGRVVLLGPNLGVVYRLNVSPGGVPKHPVTEAWVGPEGLEGDLHNDTRHHGGPERAVCLFSLEVLGRLQAEGHPVAPGSLGENVTVAGLDWAVVRPGCRLQVGEVELQVTRYTTPCATIRHNFRDGDIARVHPDRYPGEARVYARVLRTGRVRAGDLVGLVDGSE
ncbi:MAG: NUDIX domain-containing protein [Armatimonadota bacterium]|nr:NUDIX domain-containing protein [Armatimonadota bacterium]